MSETMMSSRLFGYFQASLHHAHVLTPWNAAQNSELYAHIEVTISNTKGSQPRASQSVVVIQRQSSRVGKDLTSTKFVWEEQVDVRCCEGWELYIALIVNGADGNEHILETQPLKVLPHKRASYLLKEAGIDSGSVEITFDFFSNYFSFRALAIDCMANSNLVSRLLNELTNMLDTGNHATDETMDSSEKKLLQSSVIKLKNCITDDSASIKIAELAQTKRIVTSTTTKVVDGRQVQFPDTVPMFKAASITRAFFTFMDLALPIAPELTIELLEKQLSIFCSSITRGDGDASKSGLSVATSDLQGSSLQSESSKPDGAAADELDELTWSQLTLFVYVIGLWLTQHAFIAQSLVDEFGISKQELRAVRTLFSQYDSDLSGEMASSDLGYLLQDMGEQYSADELSLILREVDPDTLCVVEFSELIRWWCEP